MQNGQTATPILLICCMNSRQKGQLALFCTILLTAVAILLGICLGSTQVSPSSFLQALFSGDVTSSAYRIVIHSRLPRVLGALLAGSALVVSGALVLPDGVSELDKSKPLGCSSLRRTLQLKKLYPDMDVRSIRGNLQTRLRKLDEGQYSALILAAAGLKRLGLESRINRYFTADEIIPAAGQGILAVQGRKGEAYDFLEDYCDKDAWAAGSAERAFVKLLDGGCSSPVAAHAEIFGDEIYLRGLYYNEKDGSYVTGTLRGNKADAESLGRELAETLRKKGENR